MNLTYSFVYLHEVPPGPPFIPPPCWRPPFPFSILCQETPPPPFCQCRMRPPIYCRRFYLMYVVLVFPETFSGGLLSPPLHHTICFVSRLYSETTPFCLCTNLPPHSDVSRDSKSHCLSTDSIDLVYWKPPPPPHLLCNPQTPNTFYIHISILRPPPPPSQSLVSGDS